MPKARCFPRPTQSFSGRFDHAQKLTGNAIRSVLHCKNSCRIVARMDTFVAVIDRWPSLQAFADDLEVPYVTAQVMRHRDSISPDHWERVVATARDRKISGVSYELLARLRARKVASKRRNPKRRAEARSPAVA